MGKELIVQKTITLNADTSTVWDALTNSNKTKKYMFACEAISNWNIGGSLIWKGVGDGILHVKGTIINIVPEKLLEYTTFGPNSGLADVPANYLTVAISLLSEGKQTMLSVTQGNFLKVIDGEKRYKNSDAGWDYALKGLKEVVES